MNISSEIGLPAKPSKRRHACSKWPSSPGSCPRPRTGSTSTTNRSILDGKFKLMAEMDGFDGVEIVYPYEVNDAAADQGGVEKVQAEGRRRQRERQGRARVPKRRADLARQEDPQQGRALHQGGQGLCRGRRRRQGHLLPARRRLRVRLPARLCRGLEAPGRDLRGGRQLQDENSAFHRVQAERDPRPLFPGHGGQDALPAERHRLSRRWG